MFEVEKILIIKGAFGEVYEPSWLKALNEMGFNAKMFDSHKLTMPGVIGRIERRVLSGYGVQKIRKDAYEMVRVWRPDVVMLYQGHYFDLKTICKIKKYSKVVGYHNDDPFASRSYLLRYRHLLKALPAYDGFHVYRWDNVIDVKSRGVKNVNVLMPYYLPWLDYPRNNDNRYLYDLVYVGHAEPDYRMRCLCEAGKNGLKVGLYGRKQEWQKGFEKENLSEGICIKDPVYGSEYRDVLSFSKISACFFSKWNRDKYTRRVFEITACGSLLLCERTPIMMDLFKEDIEAVYFSSCEEFVEKATYYTKNIEQRNRIAEAGKKRVCHSGHDIYSRMKQWIDDLYCWFK